MRTDLFDFELPATSIALRPASPRDAARMLVVEPDGALSDSVVSELPQWLKPGDQLVVNDTKVISAQLKGRRIGRETEPKIEATLIKRLDGSRWQALVKPAKSLASATSFASAMKARSACSAISTPRSRPRAKRARSRSHSRFMGQRSIRPSTISARRRCRPTSRRRRTPDDATRADYQTMFAVNEGAVAAPTAGLHFTPGLEAALRSRGVELHRLTLHVGAGTFLPVKVEETSEHRMHAEWGSISADTAGALNAARARGGRIVAVGTTSLRLLESAATEDGTIRPFDGETSIFITPGYRFRAVDLLMTNFHLPRSTLFMLVSAFSGLDTMKQAYAHAIAVDTGSIPTGTPACCFADRIECGPQRT